MTYPLAAVVAANYLTRCPPSSSSSSSSSSSGRRIIYTLSRQTLSPFFSPLPLPPRTLTPPPPLAPRQPCRAVLPVRDAGRAAGVRPHGAGVHVGGVEHSLRLHTQPTLHTTQVTESLTH